MIASLSGKIGGRIGNSVIVEVNGIGYQVHVASSTLETLGMVGDAVRLVVVTQVREDAIKLFGFSDEAERDTFLLVTKVQGVGASIGLSLISELGSEGLLKSIASSNKAALSRAHGVGARIAARLITELHSVVCQSRPDLTETDAKSATKNATIPLKLSGEEDARKALLTLGYSRSEIDNIFVAIRSMQPPPSETGLLVKTALQLLSTRF